MSLRSKHELLAWYKTRTPEQIAARRERRNRLARQAELTSQQRSELATLQDELEQLVSSQPDGSFDTQAYDAAKREEVFWSQFANKPLSKSDIKKFSEHAAQLAANLKRLP